MLDLPRLTEPIKDNVFIAFFPLSNTLSTTSETALITSGALVVVIDHPWFAMIHVAAVLTCVSSFETISPTTASFWMRIAHFTSAFVDGTITFISTAADCFHISNISFWISVTTCARSPVIDAVISPSALMSLFSTAFFTFVRISAFICAITGSRLSSSWDSNESRDLWSDVKLTLRSANVSGLNASFSKSLNLNHFAFNEA